LSNAVKFTPEHGAISLNAKLAQDESDHCIVRVYVTDTGVGIREDQQAKLFNPFEQAESSTTRKYGGTGLGLAITKRIVEMMGGEISVSSIPGEGSTFSFSFKAGKADEDAERNLLLSQDVIMENIRILVIDEDSDIREYFVDLAMRFNITCDTAKSGDEALELIQSGNQYDICFIDCKEPFANSLELSRLVKDANDDVYIVMISLFEWQELETDAKAAGVDRFLQKPILPSAFIESINICFNIDLLNEDNGRKNERTDRFWGYRALLVEDVDINREIVIALLEPTLLDIDCAENGLEAVRIFSEDPEKYNIIFMDLQMPEMDGYDATRAIRALDNEKAGTIPIIAMTANVFKEDIVNCLAAGMNDHIGKPLDFEAVLIMLRRYLYKQSPAKERRKEDRRKSGGDRRQMPDRRKGERRRDAPEPESGGEQSGASDPAAD